MMNETEIVKEVINKASSFSVETYVLIGGFVISIWLLIVAILTLKQGNKIQRQNIFHDLFKIEDSLWEKVESIGGRKGIEKLLNFYEYLSFLYFQGVVDKKMAENMFKSELIKNYEKYNDQIKPEFTHLASLYKFWNNKKNMIQDKKTIWQRIWEPEDSRLFGELFLIIGGFLIAKWVELVIPHFVQIKWIYFGIGFIFVLYAVKLLRKSEKE